MSKYAFRVHATHMTLVETANVHVAELKGNVYLEPCSAERARQWVANDGHHETALFVDYDGKVRYASDPEGGIQ